MNQMIVDIAQLRCTRRAAVRAGLVPVLAALLLVFAGKAHAQAGPTITSDLRFHNAGQVEQVVTNLGMLNFRVIGAVAGEQNTEWPAGSFDEYMGDFGIMVGGIPQGGESQGDTLVSVGNAFGASPTGSIYYDYAFRGYSDAPWDTIWVAERGDTIDVPYAVPYPDGSWYRPERDSAGGGYVPVSDQDFVTRYNDYNPYVLNTTTFHEPLYLDVVQTSYAWSSPPLDNIIAVNVTVKAVQYDIEQGYVGLFVDPNIGYRPADVSSGDILGDDYSTYMEEFHMGVGHDAEGGTDAANEPYGVAGTMLLAPEDNGLPEEVEWRWRAGYGGVSRVMPETYAGIYRLMSGGSDDPDQQPETSGQTHYVLSAGPIDLPRDSTYTFTTLIVLAEDERELRDEAELLQFAYERGFRLPQPPPAPPLKAAVSTGTVYLDWRPGEEERNPETYQDPNRGDDVEQPFEGYRVWKSTQNRSGPWTLLGVYDIEGNGYGPSDSGLRRQYTDDYLINNVPYFYSVTAFSKRDTTIGEEGWPSQESSIIANAVEVIPSSGRGEELADVAVVPNPYRGDVRYQDINPPWEKPPASRERWLEQDRRLTFINLPGPSTIRVYTLSGTLVETIEHRDPNQFFAEWNLTSSADQAIASGIYLFTVEETESGKVHTGKFVVIK